MKGGRACMRHAQGMHDDAACCLVALSMGCRMEGMHVCMQNV